MQRDEILRRLRKHKQEFASQYGIKRLELFGSCVRDEQASSSDVDLLVDFDDTPTLFQFVRIQQQLTDLLEVRVDLVMREALKPGIGERILQEAVPV